MMRILRRVVEMTGALLLAAPILIISALALLIADGFWAIFGRSRLAANRAPDLGAASIVIPNWNGRDLLAQYLPSVMESVRMNKAHEVIVVDNGSSDGSAEFIRENFPEVRVLELPSNLGFGGGANAGFRAARNDIVVLLNSDMRVRHDFLAPLLAGFTGDDVFAVSCQIFLTDYEKRREETGLTEGWWENGKLRVSHREDPAIDTLFPCFYAGGGSAAFDRLKFLELGGFDELLAPFYLEDTDLGFMAWKRGWKVMYQPASVVFHEHRGTIGRKFSERYIQSVLKKNYVLFAWKNVIEWERLLAHFGTQWAGVCAAALLGDRPLRPSLGGLCFAFVQLPGALRSRWKAHSLRAVTDTEAFERSRPSHFRDRFLPVASSADQLRVLFVSPYPILPPAHGGAVFMGETLRELSRLCEVHALVLLDEASQSEANKQLADFCATVELMVRPRNPSLGSLQPHAVEEFRSRDVRWLMERIMYLRRIDIVQIEYTPMGQYVEPYQRIAAALFAHDIYFQSIARTLQFINNKLLRAKACFEYVRALRFEMKMFARCDQVQVCTEENRLCLLEFRPSLRDRVRSGLRAAINTQPYNYPGGPRCPGVLLFVGSARHRPNKIGVDWFLARVFPQIVSRLPEARLLLAGFEPAAHTGMAGVEMLGYIKDVKPLLETSSVFVCPVLSGSGVRVKLIEAFASGIPVISTRIGAEGLARVDGEFCALADHPEEFAARTIELLREPEKASQMIARARREVEVNWDSVPATARLEAAYRETLAAKRARLFGNGHLG